MKASAIAFVALVSLVGAELSAQTGVNQTTSGVIYAASTGGNTCYSDGCAKATTIRVYLPLDANIIKIHLLSAGVDRDDMHENRPGQDIQWATWAPPVQGTTPKNKYVDVSFLNRSHNKQRKVQVVVDWNSRR